MSLVIREMKKEDIKKVQSVAKKSWSTTYNGVISHQIQENFLSVAYSDEMMETRFKNSIIYVAELKNEIVGFANFTPVNSEGQSELSAIYIYEACQGKGIGSALLQKGINELENLKEVCINVEKENSVGKTFYKAKGFKTMDEYDDNFDGYILKTVRMYLTV